MAVLKSVGFLFIITASLLHGAFSSVKDCTFVTSEGKTIDLNPLISKE